MTNPHNVLVAAEFEFVKEIRTRLMAANALSVAGQRPGIAIALSGGLDSSALLHLVANAAVREGVDLFAFHVHHGISLHADQWLAHCRSECALLGIQFDARHIQLSNKNRAGVEEAARASRYAALGQMCRAHRISLLLTAHHQDDQAETLLLQLLRGSGVAGLSGMDQVNTAPTLLGDADLLMARPLLRVSRSALSDYVTEQKIQYVDDESNADPRFARNALRHQVMPALATCFPGFQQRFARSAAHAQAAQRLLVELAAQDLAVCRDGDYLVIERFRDWSQERIDNLLRYWFGSQGVRMPSTSWLNELRTQLLEAKSDAQLCVTHADCQIRRHRDRVHITPRREANAEDTLPQQFRWNGEAEMRFDAFGGVLHFDAAEQGMDADWLRGIDLTLRLRSGGERLKPAWNRPTKSLKYHYQACDVPAWERERLPIVVAGQQLLFAAGIGMDCHCISDGAGVHIRLRWSTL